MIHNICVYIIIVYPILRYQLSTQVRANPGGRPSIYTPKFKFGTLGRARGNNNVFRDHLVPLPFQQERSGTDSGSTWWFPTDFKLNPACSFGCAPREHKLTVTVAVIVTCARRRLRTTRVYQHRNLLLAVVARNVLVMLSKSLVILDELYAKSEVRRARVTIK